MTLERLVKQFDRIYHGPCWVGVSIKDVLEGIDEHMAIKTVQGQHLTIWQLVHHITVWNDTVTRRLNGEAYIPPPEVDFATIVDTSANAWAAAKERMFRSAVELKDAAGKLEESMLDQPILPEYTSRFNHLNGALLHAMYHAGQIGIVKKMLSSCE